MISPNGLEELADLGGCDGKKVFLCCVTGRLPLYLSRLLLKRPTGSGRIENEPRLAVP